MTRRGTAERQESSVVELIGTMRRIAGVINSPLGMHGDGTLSEVGHVCLDHLKAAAADLADTEPATLDDLAALVAYGRAHVALGTEAARAFDPVRAVADLEIAVALLAKASKQLETMTGRAPGEPGFAQRLN